MFVTTIYEIQIRTACIESLFTRLLLTVHLIRSFSSWSAIFERIEVQSRVAFFPSQRVNAVRTVGH